MNALRAAFVTALRWAGVAALGLLIGAGFDKWATVDNVPGIVVQKSLSFTDSEVTYLLVLDVGGGRRIECHATPRLFVAAEEGAIMSCPARMVSKQR